MGKIDKDLTKEWWKEQEKLARKFRLSAEDIHNLYDLFYIFDSPPQMCVDMRETLKLNKMHQWFHNLHDRLEKICLVELEK